jgi:hypothetical protein
MAGAISAIALQASIRRLTRKLRLATYRRMSDDAPDSLIPYDEIVQEALRAVVGRVLGEVMRSGGELPGNHHFYITSRPALSASRSRKACASAFPTR